MRTILCLSAIALVLGACAPQGSNSGPVSLATPVRHQSASYVNGKLLYTTGVDHLGFRMMAQSIPMRPTCAACHGANGAGGRDFPDGAISADLRHYALVADEKHPYTLALLERAISNGIDNRGKPLDPVMPRWKLSKSDLHDVAAYVLTLH